MGLLSLLPAAISDCRLWTCAHNSDLPLTRLKASTRCRKYCQHSGPTCSGPTAAIDKRRGRVSLRASIRNSFSQLPSQFQFQIQHSRPDSSFPNRAATTRKANWNRSSRQLSSGWMSAEPAETLLHVAGSLCNVMLQVARVWPTATATPATSAAAAS